MVGTAVGIALSTTDVGLVTTSTGFGIDTDSCGCSLAPVGPVEAPIGLTVGICTGTLGAELGGETITDGSGALTCGLVSAEELGAEVAGTELVG